MGTTGTYLADLAQEMSDSSKVARTIFDDEACINWNIDDGTLALFDYEYGEPLLFWNDRPGDKREDFASFERFIALAKTTTDTYLLYLLASPVWRHTGEASIPSEKHVRHLRLVKRT